MKSGRFQRNWYVVLLGLISFSLVVIFKYSPVKMINYTDLMSGALSFASIATGLLFATFSLVPAFSNSRLLNALKQLKTDRKVLDRILIATFLFFAASVISFFCLFMSPKSDNLISICFIGVWLAIIVMGILEVFLIIRLLFLALEKF